MCFQKFSRLLCLLCCLGASLSASGAEEKTRLDLDHLDAEWSALFDAMRAVDRVAAPFIEKRSFAFRKAPKTYRGVFRKSANGEVSLAYSEPEVMALHLGEGFAYYRKNGGAIRQIPSSHTQSDALSIFPPLLNFNLSSVAALYVIEGQGDLSQWQLRLKAKEAFADELAYGEILIAGAETAVQRIELIKSEQQRVVIEMGDPVYPEFYLPEIRAKYFFRPDSNE